MSVRPVSTSGNWPLKMIWLIRCCQFGSYRVFAEQLVIRLRAGSAVAILIGDGNQALVEERVALPGDLHPRAMSVADRHVSPSSLGFIAQYLYLTAAGGCVNADDLLVTAQFGLPESPAPSCEC